MDKETSTSNRQHGHRNFGEKSVDFPISDTLLTLKLKLFGIIVIGRIFN